MTPSRPRHALLPGTFDPFTLGHLDILERALRLFDRVTVGVAEHHDKHQLFAAAERRELIERSVEHLERVHVASLSGLLVDGARALGVDVVVRGVRTAQDLDYERQMALTNRALDPRLETVLVLPAGEHAHISSTLVRQIARMGGDVSGFVPAPVLAALARRLAGDRA